jgi:hypothetical protein
MFDFLKRFKKRRYGKYTDSARADKYELIAAQHGTTAQHVYELAHGRPPLDLDDDRIIQSLKAAGIIFKI